MAHLVVASPYDRVSAQQRVQTPTAESLISSSEDRADFWRRLRAAAPPEEIAPAFRGKGLQAWLRTRCRGLLFPIPHAISAGGGAYANISVREQEVAYERQRRGHLARLELMRRCPAGADAAAAPDE
eukprot:1426835-Alexandrium_andersonii.AAC.1